MAPRTLALIILATLIALAPPVSAKEKKKPTKDPERTWKTVAAYVLKNGSENPIKSPSSKTLGYDSDVVPAKGLRIKSAVSKDKKEHAVYVTYETDEKGKISPKDIILGVILVSETPGGKTIDGYRVRLNLDGSIITVMKAGGVVGGVKQTTISPNSEEALSAYKSEKNHHLKEIKLEQLTQ